MKLRYWFVLIFVGGGCLSFIGRTLTTNPSSITTLSAVMLWVTVVLFILFWFWPLIKKYGDLSNYFEFVDDESQEENKENALEVQQKSSVEQKNSDDD